MQTMNEYAQNTYNFAYFGERGDWLIAWASSNYSETVVRANCIAIQRALSDGNFEVETFKGPLAGVYGEWILVDPANTVAVEIAESILAELEDYPVVDDEVLSELEYDEACESAYAACDIDREHALDAAPFIVSKSEDNGRGVGYSHEYWPTESDVFFGYLAYRRFVRRRKVAELERPAPTLTDLLW